jgi:hypothetical protein
LGNKKQQKVDFIKISQEINEVIGCLKKIFKRYFQGPLNSVKDFNDMSGNLLELLFANLFLPCACK